MDLSKLPLFPNYLMTNTDKFFLANQANWNDRADIHIRDVARFYAIDELVAGANVLTPIERHELGDLTGLRLAHFQCHIGTDTLSLKRMGAAEVVGLDFSPAALGHARELARRTGLEVQFAEGNVYDAATVIGTGFDLVFTSWGTICWLDDLDQWAGAIAAVLRPGGRLYFADTHPYALTLDGDDAAVLRPAYDYQTPLDSPLAFDEATSYDGSNEAIQNPRTYQWQHSVSAILNALIRAGISIDFVNEHYALPWEIYKGMHKGEDRLFRMAPEHVKTPLAISIGGTLAGAIDARPR